MKTKRLIYVLMAVCMLCCTGALTSCSGDEEELQEELIDLDNLIGKWQDNGSKTEFWRYNEDWTGVYWDESETTEEQASTGNRSGLFQWSFDEQTGLMRIFWMETLGEFSDPNPGDPVIIEELTPTRMTYKDKSGRRTSLTKVN